MATIMPVSSPATVDEAFAEGMMIKAPPDGRDIPVHSLYTDDEVTQLANAIVEQQEVEISQMKGILEGSWQGQWSQPPNPGLPGNKTAAPRQPVLSYN